MKLCYQCWIIYSSDTNCPCHFLSAWSHTWSCLLTNYLLSSAYFQQSIKHVWFCSEIEWYHFLNIHLVFYLSLFQHWFSWWLQQRLAETWHTSHLEMLSSWEMFMKYTLSSPTNKSPSVRQIHFSFVVGVSVHAAVTQLLSCQPCFSWALTVNNIMSRNGDDISHWWGCGALVARTAHGGCPWDSMHK